jgi:ribosome maturation protein Sdo1
VHRAPLVTLVHPARRVHRAHQAARVQQDQREILALRVRWVLKVLLALPEIQVLRVQLVLRVPRDLKELKVLPALKDHRAPPVPKVNLESRAPLARRDR